ncbi:hypothetical protein PV327_003650 [Microctonus hyperodae]|uniref:Uncharacterized protein n=1 Tax=Microctonus hyperodae TaxID=165561 RepID=A0AA39L138_MICHY|nr:hypothetical protein PV327_003650 [Microctonus hyperodae]
MSSKDQSRRRTPSRLRQIRLCESTPNLKAFFSITQNHNNSVMMPPNEKINYNTDKLRRGNSLRIPVVGAEEQGIPLRRGGSLNFKRTSQNHRIINQHHHVSASDVINDINNPSCCNLNNNNETNYETSSNTHSAPVLSAPAPEYLAISLLQLGCPLISMPRPRGGVGLEHLPLQSSDSDDSTTSHHQFHHQQQQQQSQTQNASSQSSMEGYGLPKVQIHAPSSTESQSPNE